MILIRLEDQLGLLADITLTKYNIYIYADDTVLMANLEEKLKARKTD